MELKDTVERLYARYNTYTRRPTVQDERTRRIVFRAFERTLGPWLPADRTTPILDIGCGEGALLAFLRARGYTNLAGFDLSPENVRICHALGLDFVEQGGCLVPGRALPAWLVRADLRHGPARAPAEAAGSRLPGAGAAVPAARRRRDHPDPEHGERIRDVPPLLRSLP